MKKVLSIAAVVLTLLLMIPASAAADNEVRLALLGFENMEENGEHDYLSGLISAILREDLSETEGITLLDRRSINSILDEQRLQISGLFEESEAVEVGKLLGSDYLAGGSFVVIGAEVLLDLTLIEVQTSRVLSFSSRGGTEDMIHTAAEKITRKLIGKMILYRTADSAIPIIKQELLPPGKLKLFSPMVDARLYIDDEFYGYTTGVATLPIEVELQPGLHSVEIDQGPNFGVVIEPEIRFEHWNKEFRVVSGKTVVLEDPTRHFNDRLYRIQKVLDDDVTLYGPEFEDYHEQWPFSFVDRKGNPVEGFLTIHLLPAEDGSVSADILLVYGYDRKVYSLECEAGEELELEEVIELVDLSVELDCRYSDRVDVDLSIRRNDVYQGMHRE